MIFRMLHENVTFLIMFMFFLFSQQQVVLKFYQTKKNHEQRDQHSQRVDKRR